MSTEMDRISKTPGAVTFLPATGKKDVKDYAKWLDSLDELFHDIKSRSRKGKRLDPKVIDDGRILPSERLKYFVEAAKKEGVNPVDAIEFALNRMEGLGEDIAGAMRPNRNNFDWSRLMS